MEGHGDHLLRRDTRWGVSVRETTDLYRSRVKKKLRADSNANNILSQKTYLRFTGSVQWVVFYPLNNLNKTTHSWGDHGGEGRRWWW